MTVWPRFPSRNRERKWCKTALTSDSAAFAKRMLREIGVATTPGIDFDPVRGDCFVRLSYAGPHAAMREAAARIKRWLKV